MGDLLHQVEKTISDRRLFARGEKILVAVSGGLDSMVLLHVLAALAPKHGWKLTVAHFNHKLRGRSSDADERLVHKTAATLKLPIKTARADVKRFAKRERISIEMAARKLRHDFFAKTARKQKISTVALAHHADDQVELFFLRLLRGAGEGLSGMHWKSPSPANQKIRLVRPLLDQTKPALAEFAAANRIRFREDASNACLDFQRNRIRHDILPLLKKFQPALVATLLRTMEIIREESNLVLGAALEWLANKKRSSFTDLPVAVQRKCIAMQLRYLGVPPDFELIEHLRLHPDRLINVSPAASLSRTKAGEIAQKRLTSLDGGESAATIVEAKLSLRGQVPVGDTIVQWVIQRIAGASFQSKKNTEFFDADKIGRKIILRHWQPGDRFQPIGMKSPVKLQDLFVNAKIPAAERRMKVIGVAENGRIFWVEGLRISEEFKLDKATRRRLKWSWRKCRAEVAAITAS